MRNGMYVNSLLPQCYQNFYYIVIRRINFVAQGFLTFVVVDPMMLRYLHLAAK